MARPGPLRDGARLVRVARLAGAPVGVLAVADPDQTAGDADRVAMEHAATVLAMEVARLQGLGETTAHRRSQLVLDLVGGADLPGSLNRAQALGYDLGARTGSSPSRAAARKMPTPSPIHSDPGAAAPHAIAHTPQLPRASAAGDL